MTQLQTPNRTLGQLNDEERYHAFDDLQLSMDSAWDSIQKNLADESVVVVPSISIERTTLPSAPAPSRKRWRSARCSCCCCSVSRGCA